MVKQIASAVVVALCAVSGTARASSIVFSDFGPGDAFDHSNAYGIGAPSTDFPNRDVAARFVPNITVTFDFVRLAVSNLNGGNALTVAIAPDDSGHPGNPVESFAFTLTTTPTIVTGTSTLHPLLLQNTPYWIIASVPANVFEFEGWWDNSTGAHGQVAGRPSAGGAWFVNGDVTLPAFEVAGTPAASAVPEPATITLTVIGLAGGMIRRRRRIR